MSVSDIIDDILFKINIELQRRRWILSRGRIIKLRFIDQIKYLYSNYHARCFQNTNAGIKLTVLLQDEDTLIFTPNFNKVQHEMLRMVDGIVRSVQTFARVDSIVIPDLPGPPELLKVKYINETDSGIPLKSQHLADRSERYH